MRVQKPLTIVDALELVLSTMSEQEQQETIEALKENYVKTAMKLLMKDSSDEEQESDN